MEKSNFMKQLRGLTYDFVTNDKILERPKGITGRRNLDNRKIRFLRDFLDLILNNERFITSETKHYIINKYISAAGVADKFKCNEKTVSTKIWRDKNKISGIFGDGMISDILFNANADMDFYERKLDEARVKYSDVRLLSSIDLDLPQGVIKTSIPDDLFNEFIETISPYIKSQKAAIEQEISDEAVGYVKWLLTSDNSKMTEKDLERKERLYLLLGGIEYTIGQDSL